MLHPLPLASISGPLFTCAWHFVRDAGLPAIFALTVAESACIPIPVEATMMFAGVAVANPGGGPDHHLTMFGVVLVGVLGNLVGSWIAYGLGRAGRLRLVERQQRLLAVNASHRQSADRWFARYGVAPVFFSRMVPLVRTFISLPAGIAKMPFARFTVLTVLGCIPFLLGLALAGRALGHEWRRLRIGFEYVDYGVLALVAIGLAYSIASHLRGRHSRRELTSAPERESAPGWRRDAGARP